MCAATFFCFYHFWVIFSICDASFFLLLLFVGNLWICPATCFHCIFVAIHCCSVAQRMVEQWKARCAELRWFLFVSNFSICYFLLFNLHFNSLMFSRPVHGGAMWKPATCAGAISLVGNFGAHPLKTRVKWAQIAKTLARLPLLHFCAFRTKFSPKIIAADHQ